MFQSRLTIQEIESMGFAHVGHDVQLSRFARFYNPAGISLGNHVRIDDFCVLSAGEGGIYIGNFVHVGLYSSLVGRGKISVGDFCNISTKVSIHSSGDDPSGRSLTNPTIPEKYKNVLHADVIIERHAGVGSGSVVLPGVKMGEGSVLGALSLLMKSCEAFGIYFGSPAKRIKTRKRDLLQLEAAFLEELARNEQQSL